MKLYFYIIIGILVFLIISGVIINISCQALVIVRTHDGETTYQLQSMRGNEFEPDNCGRFPLVFATE